MGDSSFDSTGWEDNLTAEGCASLCIEGCSGFVYRASDQTDLGKCKLYKGTLDSSEFDGRICYVKNPEISDSSFLLCFQYWQSQ